MRTTDAPWPPISRRVRAARTLAGLTVEELIARIETPGLGVRTYRKIEAEERPVRPMEIREIARACEVPEAFFYADLNLLQVVVDEWPTEPALEDAGLADYPPDRIVRMAFRALAMEQGQRRLHDVGDVPGVGPVVLETRGGDMSAAQETVMRDVFAQMLEQVVKTVEETFRERLTKLEDEVSTLRRQSGRDEAEQAIEAAAQTREQPPGSTGSTTRGRPSRARER